ncbi:MAG: phosphoglycolate phosphatase [Gammaproteobacteria bacterium]|nr:phosphoglycolate phosphatase [Gammaproteobacteria bacterium]
MYKAFLFDLDGTLVDTAPDLHLALNYTLNQVDLGPVSLALTRHWVGHGARVMIDQALKDLEAGDAIKEQIDVLHTHFLTYYSSNIAVKSIPFGDAEELLERLADLAIPMGVVTNKFYQLSFELLKALDLYKYFDVLVGGDTLQVQKPEAEPALYACNELDVDPNRVLFVGDSKTDIACAKAAGCDVAIIRNGYNQGEDPSTLGASLVFDSFLELLDESGSQNLS